MVHIPWRNDIAVAFVADAMGVTGIAVTAATVAADTEGIAAAAAE